MQNPVRPFAAEQGWQRVQPPSGGAPGGTGTGQGEVLPSEDALDLPGGLFPGQEPPTKDVPVLLLRNNNLLRAILWRLARTVQRGYVYSVTLVVSDPIVPLEVSFDPPLFSITIVNDGAGNVQFRAPNRSEAVWTPLAPTEQFTANFIEGLIGSVGFRSVGAGTPTIRVFGTF